MAAFLVSYRPLAVTARGRQAAKSWGIPLYADGSCRREPDLQSHYPSITALCRGGLFAPKLCVGDEVLYITVKSAFGSKEPPHYKLVAHLRVIFCSRLHEDAAVWYETRGLPMPSNCMVSANPPVPYEQTNGKNGKNWHAHPEATRLKWWDGGYRKRAKLFGSFVHCEALYLNISNPLSLLKEDFIQVFGRVPSTQNPPRISNQERDSLIAAACQRCS